MYHVVLFKRHPSVIKIQSRTLDTRVYVLLVLRGFLSMLSLRNTRIGQEPDGAVTRRDGLLLICTVFLLSFCNLNILFPARILLVLQVYKLPRLEGINTVYIFF